MQAGDIIDVKSFGNMSLDVVARVGADGKLFLPVIGPVSVAGVSRASLNGTLQSALGAIYTNTTVYADIVQPGAIGVYVTGQVPRPGRYLGAPTDTILYYLDKAGGIDGLRGSFRDVLVRHTDGRQEDFDLYDFLIQGNVAKTKFGDGDVIVIRPRGPQVVVTGLAANSYAFELAPPPGTPLNTDIQAGLAGSIANGGQQIVTLARPNERLVTGAYVASVRDKKTVTSYRPYADFAKMPLGDGDHVEFRADTLSPTITVTLSAKLGVPSIYVTPRDATLKEVLAGIAVDGTDADIQSVYVVRKSVAAQQKQLLNVALLQLQEDASTPSGIDAQQAQAQASAIPMVQQFVAAASQIQPNGQIAIYRNGKFQDIHLQDGDQIVIPEKTDVVLVAGEVLAPGGFAHRDGATIKDYIDDAGGYTEAANTGKFVLRKPNGSAQLVDDDAVPQPGDSVMVVPEVSGMTFQLIKDISTLIYQVAISAATVIALK